MSEYHDESIRQYGSLEEGVAYVEGKLTLGQWSINQDEYGNHWLHTNPDGVGEQGSVYANSREVVIETHVFDRARMIGYDWAFES